jgi:lysyl-tRNA synthetase class 2
MSVRDQGKACFAELQDSEGHIHFLNRDVLCPGEDKTVYNQVLKIN